MNALWERPDFRRAAGDAWRPGGVALTGRALDKCAASGWLPPGGLVLDLGCGAGATLRMLAGRGYRALGLDKNAGAEPLALDANVDRPQPGRRCAGRRRQRRRFFAKDQRAGRQAGAFSRHR